MTTLCFDLGNTRQKCALFEEGIIKEVRILPDARIDSIAQLVEELRPSKTILSSVISHDPKIEEVLASHSVFHKLTIHSRLPFITPLSKPENIGTDRLALAAAAVTLYKGQHNLVIALGSCITCNFINKNNEFLGGSISPGKEMRFKALNIFTAKLPLVEADRNFPLTGYDTRTSILSGILRGIVKEIDGIIEDYKEKYRNFNVLLTGGDSPYFAPHLKNKIFADPELIFKGLFAISEHNDDIKT